MLSLREKFIIIIIIKILHLYYTTDCKLFGIHIHYVIKQI